MQTSTTYSEYQTRDLIVRCHNGNTVRFATSPGVRWTGDMKGGAFVRADGNDPRRVLHVIPGEAGALSREEWVH